MKMVSNVNESVVVSRRNFLKYSAFCALPALCISYVSKSRAKAPPGVVAGSDVVNVREMGALGNKSHDDTAAFQNSINALPASGGTIVVPPGDYMIDTSRSVRLRNRTHLKLETGARLFAIPNALKRSYVLLIEDVSDVEISGGQIIGDRDSHLGTSGEWGYGIFVRSAERVNVHDIHISDCWGDGICVGALMKGTKVVKMSDGVQLTRIVSTRNRRQGLSIGPARNVTVTDSEFSYTHGTSPSCGIDIEPEKMTYAKNIKISGCRLIGNSGCGLQVYEDVYSTSVNKCIVKDNGSYGILVVGGDGCAIESNDLYGNGFVGAMIKGDSKNCRISGNTFKNNSFKTLKSALNKVREASGYEAKGRPSDISVAVNAKNIVVSNNVFSD